MDSHVHILPKRIYYTVFGILLLCTYLTVQIAFFDLGPLNTMPSAAIVLSGPRSKNAILKATLVILYFMHVKYSPKLTTAVVAGSVFWFGILIVLTMSDYLTRAWRTFG